MKKTTLILVIAVVAMSSCTKIIYSHSETMSIYRTQKQVLEHFGEPTQKDQSGGLSLWTYNFERSLMARPTTRARYLPTPTRKVVSGGYFEHDSADSSALTASQYDRFVKFAFDKDGNTVGWTTKGVDFAQRQPNGLGTAFIVLGGVALVFAIIGTIALVNDVSNWK